MIEVHGYTHDGRHVGTRTIEQDNISDRRAVIMAFHSFTEVITDNDLAATTMTDGYAVSLNLNLYVERKPCMKPEPSH